jgi:hypothetical protein
MVVFSTHLSLVIYIILSNITILLPPSTFIVRICQKDFLKFILVFLCSPRLMCVAVILKVKLCLHASLIGFLSNFASSGVAFLAKRRVTQH